MDINKVVTMSRLIIRKGKNKYRLYCDTVDCFTTDMMTKDEMTNHLRESSEFKGKETYIMYMFYNCIDRCSKFYTYSYCLKQHRKNRW